MLFFFSVYYFWGDRNNPFEALGKDEEQGNKLLESSKEERCLVRTVESCLAVLGSDLRFSSCIED